MVAALPDDVSGLRDKAILLIGVAGAFRRSELVGLQVRDVQISDAGLIITLRRSKTDQEGASVTKGIPVGTSEATCPKYALEAWRQLAGITSGPIFRPVDRWNHVGKHALSSLGVARAVKRALTAIMERQPQHQSILHQCPLAAERAACCGDVCPRRCPAYACYRLSR